MAYLKIALFISFAYIMQGESYPTEQLHDNGLKVLYLVNQTTVAFTGSNKTLAMLKDLTAVVYSYTQGKEDLHLVSQVLNEKQEPLESLFVTGDTQLLGAEKSGLPLIYNVSASWEMATAKKPVIYGVGVSVEVYAKKTH